MTLVPMVAALSPEDEAAQVKYRPGPMASSGTQVHWAGPGLGEGSRRRRWAWAEEQQEADGCGPHSWGEEGPFAKATSPELLDDFHLAQQRLQPLEWDAEPRPDGCQDSGSGESAGEGETGPQTHVGDPQMSHLLAGGGEREGVLEIF